MWNAFGEKCGLMKNSPWITRVTEEKVNGNTGRGERPRTPFMKQMNTGIKLYNVNFCRLRRLCVIQYNAPLVLFGKCAQKFWC